MNAIVSDAAALGVAKKFGIPGSICLMHSGQKIPEAAMGCLTRSNGKSGDGLTKEERVINKFPEGEELKKCAHDAAKFFRTDSRHQDLLTVVKQIGMLFPIVLALDLNTTRVAAVHKLIFSLLRMYPVLLAYAALRQTVLVTPQQWRQLAEADAILTVMSTLTTLAQTEKLMVGVYGTVVLLELHTRLWAQTMQGASLQLHNSIRTPRQSHSLLHLSPPPLSFSVSYVLTLCSVASCTLCSVALVLPRTSPFLQ